MKIDAENKIPAEAASPSALPQEEEILNTSQTVELLLRSTGINRSTVVSSSDSFGSVWTDLAERFTELFRFVLLLLKLVSPFSSQPSQTRIFSILFTHIVVVACFHVYIFCLMKQNNAIGLPTQR